MARDERCEQGQVFREGLRTVSEVSRAFAPDLVVIFGTDHRRAFTTTIPAFSVVVSATALGDLGSPSGRYAVPQEEALDLASQLMTSGFDVAISRELHLDHGFGQTVGDLLGSVDACPIIPIFVNCATPPLPSIRRVQHLGSRVGQLLSAIDRRVLVLGTGGLSHSPPSMAPELIGASDAERAAANRDGRAAAQDVISPTWDRRFLRAVGEGDSEWLRGLSTADLDAGGSGAHECRTWVAAQAVAGQPLATVAYEPVPDWITGMGVAASAGALETLSREKRRAT